MGWLQGLRFQNNRQLQSSLSESQILPIINHKAQVFHDEYIRDESEQHGKKTQDVTIGDQPPLNERSISEVTAKNPRDDKAGPDHELPFITKEEVMSKKLATKPPPDDKCFSENEQLWIVVDDIVYDCSTFVFDHPGGEQVIRSFVGEDCSWQFWRFHGRDEMEQHGHPLRIGRTSGVPNRFAETPRYVGLSRLGNDDW